MKTHVAVLLLAALVSSQIAVASEYHGTVKCGGLPLPGVTVTASQNDSKLVTTTDSAGAFRFAALADGVWNVEVQMLGFERISKEVGVSPDAPAPVFDLQFSSAPSAPAMPAPASRTAAPFQQLAMTAQSNAQVSATDNGIRSEDMATLTQNSANSFLVQGSMSGASGMGQQNDWGPPGMGMMPPDGMMPGGMMPGGMMPGGMVPGGDDRAAAAIATGGGRGGMGGGPPGGVPGGGPGGGGPGGGGPGGGGPAMGGPGMGGPGMGDMGGGRGGPPGWQGRPGATAFGNARRNPMNSYNGSLSFNFGNSVLDAQTYSVTGANIAKPAYGSGRGGITFGGPLQIPHLISASRRILFTIDYQFQRSRNGTVSNATNMPTALERTGDFSQSTVNGAAVTVYDPRTGSPFPGNQIPTNRISTSAQALLRLYPFPNLPTASRNYETSWVSVSNSQNLNARLSNIRIGSKDRLNFGFGYQASNGVTPNQFQFTDTSTGRSMNASLGWSRNFTSRLTDTLQLSFSRSRQLSDPYFSGRENIASELGIAGTSQEPLNWGPPSVNFTNFAGLSDGNYSLNRNQTTSLSNSLSWVHGKHNLTFGGDYRSQQANQLGDTDGRGSFSFTGSMTSLLVNGVAQTNTGYDLADFLLGMPSTASIRYGNFDKYLRGYSYDGYVNDDWRIATRFSVVLGLRYEFSAPDTELYNRLVNLAVAPDYSSITAVLGGRSGYPRSLVNPDRNNVSPRLGFAWRPLTKGSLVVRGGLGMYYNTSVYDVIARNMAQQPPFAESLSVSGSTTSPLSLASAFTLATTSSATSTFAIDPNYRVGYAQTWNLSVQHDLPASFFGTIGYQGTKGTRLDQQFIPNSVAPGGTESTRPHSFTYETSNGDSIYHAAQFQLNRRFHSGITSRASYQYSKSIDNAGTGGRGQGNTPVAQNWLNLDAERGLSSFDQRHNLSVQVQYSSGMGMGGGTLLNGWKGTLLKDWTVSSDFNLRSGSPFTATVGGSRSQVSGTAVSNTLRADATGAPIEVDGALFNTAAFTSPAAGLWGNAGRNTIPGPSTVSVNGSLGRVFRFGERRSADFQLQAQNMLNHVTITSWGTVIGSNTYGVATGAGAMRKISLSLRIRF